MKACNGKSELGDGCVMLFVFEWYVGTFLLVVDFIPEQTSCYIAPRLPPPKPKVVHDVVPPPVPAGRTMSMSPRAPLVCLLWLTSCSAYSLSPLMSSSGCHAPSSLTLAAARPILRSASSQMIFGPPPAPPTPPPTTPTTEIVQRDLVGYASLLALGAVPAVDWVSLIGPDAVNPARLAYFSLIAVGTVYLGVKRQDIGEASPIDGKSAALAPVFASVTLGGLYLIIKYTGLNPGALYQFFACLFALLAATDLLQPVAGLGLTGALLDDPADQPYDEKREAEILNAGAAPAFAIALAVVAAYAQGPISTGGALELPVFAALNNLLGWSISMVSLGVLALDSFLAAASLLGGLFVCEA